MACSLKQGRALCFCLELEEKEEVEEMRIADCFQEKNEGGAESERKAKRRELVVSLHSSSVTVSAAGNSGDSYSPRSLLSRLLASLQRPTPVAGTGGVGEGSGCRVRFSKYCSSRKANEKKGEEVAVAVAEEETEVVEEVAATGPLAMKSTKGKGSRLDTGESKKTLIINSGKKLEDVSLNLGMGVGLVFLMARSATELNKMVELREQMQMLLEEIKGEIQKKEVSSSCSDSNNLAVSYASNRCGNENTSSHNPFPGRVSAEHLERLRQSAERSACASPKRTKRRLNFNEMEAELEVELERLEFTMEDTRQSMTSDQRTLELAIENTDQSVSFKRNSQEAHEVTGDTNSIFCGVSACELERRLNQLLEARRQQGLAELESSFDCTDDPRDANYCDSFSEDTAELNEATNGETSNSHCGVSAHELERKLQELLETRHQERITELESALECAKRKLLEKEQEVCWWRDTARLVSQRKDEALFR